MIIQTHRLLLSINSATVLLQKVFLLDHDTDGSVALYWLSPPSHCSIIIIPVMLALNAQLLISTENTVGAEMEGEKHAGIPQGTHRLK